MGVVLSRERARAQFAGCVVFAGGTRSSPLIYYQHVVTDGERGTQ